MHNKWEQDKEIKLLHDSEINQMKAVLQEAQSQLVSAVRTIHEK